MSAVLSVQRAGPLTTIQDLGRNGMLRSGISASGPMDRRAYELAGTMVGAGLGGIEITTAGVEFKVTSGECRVGFAGGHFTLRVNGRVADWPGTSALEVGDVLAITPGSSGNYGYLRFDADIDIAPVLGSIATNSRVRLGGLDGRALRTGDVVALTGHGGSAREAGQPPTGQDGPFRVVWGLHADAFPSAIKDHFLRAEFVVSTRLDRMGVRLTDGSGVFSDATILSLVSDAVTPGDIQILGDGTPIVLMRDHQPTGGYPRIATIITADLDRFAQMRPGSTVAFQPVTVEHAHHVLRSGP